MKISFNCTDDKQVVHTHKDAGLSDQVPCSKPDISPEAYLNDYRNRMPFHYIEEGSDGYYYWQYGSIMDLVINFVDEIAQSEDMPEAVLDVRIDDKSVVDPVAGIAHLGSMAMRSTADYYTLQQMDKIVGTLSQQIKDLQEGGVESIVGTPENIMSGQLLMWDSEARRLVGSPLVKGDADKSIILKTSSSDPNFASHEGAVLLGKGLRSSFPYQVLIGHYNQLDPNAIFAIGSGFSKLTPLTAFSVYRDGQVLVSSSPVSEKGVVRLTELTSLRTDLTSILSQKLDRREEVSEYPQVYVKLPNGTQEMYSISYGPIASAVPLRDDAGNLQTNSPRYAKDSANREYVDSKFESDAVFDKNLTVKGSLTVSGTSTVIDAQSLSVKDNFILTNSNQVSLIDLSGIVINKDNTSAYGIVLDPEDELLKLGLGEVAEDGTFTFLPGQAQALATRNYVNDAFSELSVKKSNATNIENGEGEGSIEQKDFIYTGDSIVFSDGTKGIQNGDIVPGAIASGKGAVALGGLRYDYYTSPETHAANLVIDPESTENWGRTPTSAEGNQSFAFGASCHAIGTFSVSGVKDSISYQRGSVSIGGSCIAGKTEEEFNEFWYDANQDKAINGGKGKKDGFITDSQGYNYKESYAFSIAMGDTCTSIGRGSISIGGGNIASGTYALAAGRSSKATSQVSIALGHQTISSGAASIAAGYNVKALSSGSISLGYSSDSSVGISRGVGTIALGVNCTAGDDSGTDYGATAIGFGALSVRRGAVALGKYNKLTEGALLMVGNGLGDSNRSNAFEVLEDGRAKVYTAPAEVNDVARKLELDRKISISDINQAFFNSLYN